MGRPPGPTGDGSRKGREVCQGYSAAETGALSQGEQTAKRRSVGGLPGSWAGVTCGLAETACWTWLGCSNELAEGGRLRGDGPWDPQEMCKGVEGD